MSSVLKGPSSNNGAAAAETTIPAESQGAKPKSKVNISHTGNRSLGIVFAQQLLL